MGDIKDPNDPQILPKGAYKDALSIKGGIPFFEHCEHSAKARGIMLGKIKPYWIKVMASEQRSKFDRRASSNRFCNSRSKRKFT